MKKLNEDTVKNIKIIFVTVLICSLIFVLIAHALTLSLIGIHSVDDMRTVIAQKAVLDSLSSVTPPPENNNQDTGSTNTPVEPDNNYNPNPEDTPPVDTEENIPTGDIEYQTENRILYDDNGIKVTLSRIGTNMFGPCLHIMIENNSSRNIYVSSKDSSTNGFTVNMWGSTEVLAGKKAVGEIYFFNSTLKDTGISEIKDIEFVLDIFDSDDWFDTIGEVPIVIKGLSIKVD